MKHKISVLTLAITSMLTGCGGGGGEQVPVNQNVVVTPPAKATTVTTNGIISGFGSVVVNGVHYLRDPHKFTPHTISSLPI